MSLRICMVSPHLPPEQAANALLPRQIGDELSGEDVEFMYVTHPPTAQIESIARDDVVYVPRRGRDAVARSAAGAVLAGARMALGAREVIAACDLVHLHGNGFIVEVGQLLARHYGKPYVITLYGTDVWHYDSQRHARFGRVVHGASCRVFYSEGLLDFARNVGLVREPPSIVIHAPVPAAFRPLEPSERRAIQRNLDAGDGPLLLTVKRLHQVAGYDVWLNALPTVLQQYPDAQLWIIGEGELKPRLEAQARELGIASHIHFVGLLDNSTLWRYYGAADLFVLPSRLESWGTVMLEALACGTPVVATNTVGGIEVQRHFPDDLRLAEKENPEALAEAVCCSLIERRRTSDSTQRQLQGEFSVYTCASRYLDVYRRAVHVG